MRSRDLISNKGGFQTKDVAVSSRDYQRTEMNGSQIDYTRMDGYAQFLTFNVSILDISVDLPTPCLEPAPYQGPSSTCDFGLYDDCLHNHFIQANSHEYLAGSNSNLYMSTDHAGLHECCDYPASLISDSVNFIELGEVPDDDVFTEKLKDLGTETDPSHKDYECHSNVLKHPTSCHLPRHNKDKYPQPKVDLKLKEPEVNYVNLHLCLKTLSDSNHTLKITDQNNSLMKPEENKVTVNFKYWSKEKVNLPQIKAEVATNRPGKTRDMSQSQTGPLNQSKDHTKITENNDTSENQVHTRSVFSHSQESTNSVRQIIPVIRKIDWWNSWRPPERDDNILINKRIILEKKNVQLQAKSDPEINDLDKIKQDESYQSTDQLCNQISGGWKLPPRPNIKFHHEDKFPSVDFLPSVTSIFRSGYCQPLIHAKPGLRTPGYKVLWRGTLDGGVQTAGESSTMRDVFEAAKIFTVEVENHGRSSPGLRFLFICISGSDRLPYLTEIGTVNPMIFTWKASKGDYRLAKFMHAPPDKRSINALCFYQTRLNQYPS